MAATLAESLAAGDPEAFAALYDRLAVRLLAAARTMTGSSAEAEDVVQDLFVELARGRARLTAVADLEAYVFTMLRNAVERVLADRAGLPGPPGHRDRVLAAIALLTMLAVVAPWLAVASPVAPPPEPRIEHRIVAQARAVGIELPVEWLAATSRQHVEPVLHPGKSPSARFHDAWRRRALLSGEL